MDGVTILQTMEVTHSGWGWNWFALIPIVAAIAFFVVGWINAGNGGGCLMAWAGFLIVLAIVLCSDAKELPPTYQYRVLIEDNVNINDFLDNYYIVEQQGITYIVEIKDE